jgi:hypothetical protein
LRSSPRAASRRRAAGTTSRSADVTSGLALLVYTITKAPDVGWARHAPSACSFSRSPSSSPSSSSRRGRAAAAPAQVLQRAHGDRSEHLGFILGAIVFANFFLLTLYGNRCSAIRR